MWSQLSTLSDRGERFVLATITDCGGSTPRKLGAQITITQDQIIGTIGGGAIEQRVIDEARALLASPPKQALISWLNVHLSHDLGMCCGGTMTVMLQDYSPMAGLYIFGAGHIGSALAGTALTAGFKVTVLDDREEWADPSRFSPEVEVICDDLEHRLISHPLLERDYAVVCTYDHPLDERLITKLSQRPLTYLGLIGSRAKWARFKKRIEQRSGVDYIDQVKCPMGIDIGAQTPGEIAISVTAELVLTRHRVLTSVEN